MSELFFIEDVVKAFAPLVKHATEVGVKSVDDFCSQYMYMFTDKDGVSWFKNIMDRSYIKLPK